MARSKVTYEWTAEASDEYGDIIDSHFDETIDGAKGYGGNLREQYPDAKIEYALVRTAGNEVDGITERHYAYLDDRGFLPDRFSTSAYEMDGPDVPKRFQR